MRYLQKNNGIVNKKLYTDTQLNSSFEFQFVLSIKVFNVKKMIIIFKLWILNYYYRQCSQKNTNTYIVC